VDGCGHCPFALHGIGFQILPLKRFYVAAHFRTNGAPEPPTVEDVETESASHALILHATGSDGCYSITVDQDGSLATTAVPCP
jgi:hypothetical protein